MHKEVLRLIFSISGLIFVFLTMTLGVLTLKGKRISNYHKISAGIIFLLILIPVILNP